MMLEFFYLYKVNVMCLPQHYCRTVYQITQSAIQCVRESFCQSLVLPFIDQSISPSVCQSSVLCQKFSPFIWPSVPLHQLTDQTISVLDSFVLRPSVAPSARQFSVHQSTSRSCCQVQGFQTIPLLLIPSAHVLHKQQ